MRVRVRVHVHVCMRVRVRVCAAGLGRAEGEEGVLRQRELAQVRAERGRRLVDAARRLRRSHVPRERGREKRTPGAEKTCLAGRAARTHRCKKAFGVAAERSNWRRLRTVDS